MRRCSFLKHRFPIDISDNRPNGEENHVPSSKARYDRAERLTVFRLPASHGRGCARHCPVVLPACNDPSGFHVRPGCRRYRPVLALTWKLEALAGRSRRDERQYGGCKFLRRTGSYRASMHNHVDYRLRLILGVCRELSCSCLRGLLVAPGLPIKTPGASLNHSSPAPLALGR
jgi:hypothetical protein